jgi:transposase InsO family protein
VVIDFAACQPVTSREHIDAATPAMILKVWRTIPTPAAKYPSIRYGERLAGSGAQSSVGPVGDFYDNAMAESIIGLFKLSPLGAAEPGQWHHNIFRR